MGHRRPRKSVRATTSPWSRLLLKVTCDFDVISRKPLPKCPKSHQSSRLEALIMCEATHLLHQQVSLSWPNSDVGCPFSRDKVTRVDSPHTPFIRLWLGVFHLSCSRSTLTSSLASDSWRVITHSPLPRWIRSGTKGMLGLFCASHTLWLAQRSVRFGD